MFRKTRVLIVDDMVFFRNEIRRDLEQTYDLEIDEAATTDEFTMKMKTSGAFGYDLVILDLNLPDGNGLSAMRKLKESGRFSNQKFIVVSFDINRAIIPLFQKSGVGGALIKPVSVRVLIDKVKSIYPELLIPLDPVEGRMEKLKIMIGSGIRKTDEMDSFFGDEIQVFFVLAGLVLPDENRHPRQEEVVTGKVSGKELKPEDDAPRSLAQALRPFIGITEQVVDINSSVCLISIQSSSISNLTERIEQLKSGLKSKRHIKSEKDLICQSVTYPDDGIDPAGLAIKLNSSFDDAYAASLSVKENLAPETQSSQQEEGVGTIEEAGATPEL